MLLVQGSGFSCSCAWLTKGSWPVGSTQVLVLCPSAREAGAHPVSSQHVITAHSVEGQAETPEKLCKCKVTNPSHVTGGQAEKEPSVRRQEPAAGQVASVGVAHLQGHSRPGSGSLTSQGVTCRMRGRGLVLPAYSGLSSWSVGHYSVLTLIIRLTGRKESGCNM